MKYIIGIIQPDRFDEVLKRLTEKEISLGDGIERCRSRPAEGNR